MKMNSNEAEEMYLETILRLKKKQTFVRSADVVEAMNKARSTVSYAVNKLTKSGYIVVDGRGGIDLTAKGLEAAEAVYERHRVIKSALEAMGVEAASAEENACRIEHIISDDVFEQIKNILKSKSKTNFSLDKTSE